MDTQKLLEGLPVKVISKDEVEVDGFALTRVDIETWKYEPFRSVGSLGYRVLLAAMDEFTASNRKPTWEPETVIRDSSGRLWRLQRFIGFPADMEEWEAFSFITGRSNPGAYFVASECTIHRHPHEFSVGDWAQCYVAHADTNAHFRNATFRVRAIGTDSGGTKCVLGPFDRHPVSCCRHVPEPNGGDANGAIIKLCLLDLRAAILKK